MSILGHMTSALILVTSTAESILANDRGGLSSSFIVEASQLLTPSKPPLQLSDRTLFARKTLFAMRDVSPP